MKLTSKKILGSKHFKEKNTASGEENYMEEKVGQGTDAFNYKLFYMLSLDMAYIIFIRILNVCMKN